jgi:hypothetical protein
MVISCSKTYKRCLLGWRCSAIKDTLSFGRNNFSSVSTLGLQWRHKIIRHDTPLPMRYKRSNSVWSPLLVTGTLRLSTNQFFFRISPTIAVGTMSNTWYALRMPKKQWKLGWRLSVMKGNFLLRPKQFSSVSHVGLEWGRWEIQHGTPCACATSSAR